MAKTNTYIVTNEQGTEEFTALAKVAAYIGVKKVTKADVEAGKYPQITIADLAEESSDTEVVSGSVAPTLEELAETSDHIEIIAVGDAPKGDVVDRPVVSNEATKNTLKLITARMEAVDADSEEFNFLCDLEDAIEMGDTPSDEQAEYLVKLMQGTLDQALTNTEDDTPALTNTQEEDTSNEVDSEDNESSDMPDESAQSLDTEYRELSDFSDEKELKKYIKGLSDAELAEWAELEGAKWNASEHTAINRMRMAMAIKAIRFPKEQGTAKKKSKSKYGHISLEELVNMVIENDIEVPDAKGDPRIERMYMIMALKKAGLIEG